MKRKWNALLRPYEEALRLYLEDGPQASLRPAQRLGRRAVSAGLETLDLALIHEQALIARVLTVRAPAARNRMIRRAAAFFAEAILPMEATHRSALEANVHLNRLNQALSQRTLDLSAANRRLVGEIAKRAVVERNLRQSEQQSIKLLAQSRLLQDQLRHLSRRILTAQEEERKRISRELHDVIAQVLTSINVRLAVLKSEASVNTRGLTRNIARTQKLVEQSVGIVHRFAYDLRPAVLDYLGLIPALHSFMKGFTKETGIRVSLTAYAEVNKLDSDMRTVLYRVAQETLSNVARHAQASRVDVSIQRQPKTVRMLIHDDGKSFDVDAALRAGTVKRMGLLGMRERVEMVGGTFSIESSPGNGTTIHARIPCRSPAGEKPSP